MKKHWYLFIIINLYPLVIFGQHDYFATDSMISVGVNLVERSDLDNSKSCELEKEGKVIVYSPYEVKEYGYNNGRVYISKQIETSDSTQRVFLERLVKGSITLYYYRGRGIKTFFLEKDTSFFIELPKLNKENNNSFRNVLSGLADSCSAVIDATKLVNYDKVSLSTLIESYNNCQLEPYPFFKYGISVGYGMDKLILTEKWNNSLNGFDYKYERTFMVGCFIDYHLHSRALSFRAEVNYSQNEFSYSYSDGRSDRDILINTKTINIPLLLRYTYPIVKYRPFINVGGIYTDYIKNQCGNYTATHNGKTIEISRIGIPAISNKQFGFVFGGGFQFNLDYRRAVSLEFRYNKLYGKKNSNLLDMAQLQLITAISF